MPGAQRVIATSGLIAVGAGSANTVIKHHKLPSTRFLIGSGVAYLLLSALAEFEPDVAKALAIAVLVTVLLEEGSGGGVLDFINNGEMNTGKKKTERFTPASTEHEPPTSTDYGSGAIHRAPANGHQLTPFPGLAPTGE